MVELLLVKDGVDSDSKDNKGRTRLSWAAWSGYGVVVKMLLAKDGVNLLQGRIQTDINIVAGTEWT